MQINNWYFSCFFFTFGCATAHSNVKGTPCSFAYDYNNQIIAYSIQNKNIVQYILDINNNDKQQQNHVHPTKHGHLTYYHEHIMVQEYQNNHLKDFPQFFFYLVGLMEHLTIIIFNNYLYILYHRNY